METYDNNLLVGVDKFGRTFDTIAGFKEGKEVGLFFWLWIGQPFARGVYDATEIVKLPDGKRLLFDPDYLDPNISPEHQQHFWGKPLWGYYNSEDEWVIRKQLEMLTAAGIDFIVFDTTNTLTYKNVYMKILKTIEELIYEGWNPPRAAFYTHSRSLDTVRALFNELYSQNLYPNAWYRVNGKPFIIAYTDVEDDIKEAQSRGDYSYNPSPLPQRILDFFEFRRPQWPSDPYHEDGFPWVEWVFPQRLYGNMMNVTVASHPNVPFSFTYTRNLVNWGRGWDPYTKQNVTENVEKGTFFQLQWDHAIEVDPDVIFVSGWNEWIAYKQIWMGEYMLCDAVSMEFSRDIEPMEGGYEDSFYIQLIMNVRRFKGENSDYTPAMSKTIDIYSSIDQWDDVSNIYRSIGLTNYGRNFPGVTQTLIYQQPAPRNNLQEIRVTHDEENIYFYIQSEKNITLYDGGNNWMNIFIGVGSPQLKRWESYDFVVNRKSREIGKTSGKTLIELLNGDYSGELVGEAEYIIEGNIMQIKIPRNLIGLVKNKGEQKFYFKVADDVENTSDIMSYYKSGKSLPLGRLSYMYYME